MKAKKSDGTWDFRECGNCGWRTKKHPMFASRCEKCCSACMIKKLKPHETLVKTRKSGRRVKSMEGQRMLFDKTPNATEGT